MQKMTREQLKERIYGSDGLTVVEVLGLAPYHEYHLPGAINVPLDDDFDAKIQQAVPDKEQEVVVYCKDSSCEASPKAAQRMEELGYQHVYDYEAGKVDWEEAGLPVES